jgi:hypothetical protein
VAIQGGDVAARLDRRLDGADAVCEAALQRFEVIDDYDEAPESCRAGGLCHGLDELEDRGAEPTEALPETAGGVADASQREVRCC